MKIWKHPWVVAACNFALMMAIFSLSRLFYFLTNQATYPDSSSHLCELMFGGVRFDLTALLYLNSVYLLLQLFHLRLGQILITPTQTVGGGADFIHGLHNLL